MTKTTSGVLTGVILGLLYGLWNARGEPTAAAISASLLGRTSQGIINGILAAYANRGATPAWRGGLWGLLIGAALGAIAGLNTHSIPQALLPSALLGLICGIVTAKAKR